MTPHGNYDMNESGRRQVNLNTALKMIGNRDNRPDSDGTESLDSDGSGRITEA